jgi:hypothetical protein
MVVINTAIMPRNGAFGTICLAESLHSEILYIVIFTIKWATYALYVVPVLIWLHLSFIVLSSVSRIICGDG